MSAQSPTSSEVEIAERPSLLERLRGVVTRVEAFVDRFDPNDDPEAEAIDLAALAAFLVALAVSTWMFLRWKYQPTQDAGHHLASAAIVADYGRPGSLYTALYEPLDPLVANSLLPQIAGRIGRLVGVTNAFRGCMVLYVAGTPLATLYALRVFGRSAWGALLAVPLVYNPLYVAGFMNMLFAAPFMIITMASFYRMLDKPSYKRVAFAAALFLILFLAHAHIFLWTGGLCALMTLAFLLIQPRSVGLRAVLRRSGDVVGAALGAVFPALLLFARWYRRTFGEGRASGGVTTTTEGASTHFGAHFPTMTEAFTNLQSSLRIYASTTHVDLIHFAWLAALAGVAVSLARMQRFDKPPVLELCFVVTFVSYFFLPDSMTGHDVISGRQPGVALWFLPALVSPVSSRTSRLARLVVIAGIASLTYVMLHVWHEVLWKFEKYEVAGLEAVMKAAPPRLRLHYAKLDGESKYFNWQPFLHVEGFYMSDKFGQTPDNPGILSTGAIHYRAGVNFHRVVETWGFEREPEIWNNFDLVLVRKWQPEPSNIADARERGVRIAKSHDWELWLSGRASPIEPSK